MRVTLRHSLDNTVYKRYCQGAVAAEDHPVHAMEAEALSTLDEKEQRAHLLISNGKERDDTTAAIL